jgi:quinol monooxygenase YgiN
MVQSFGTLTFAAQHHDAARQMLSGLAAQTRREPGCLAYRVSEDLESPGVFLIHEQWQDMAAMQTHLALPGVAEAVGAVQAMGVDDLRITAWETSNPTTIF